MDKSRRGEEDIKIERKRKQGKEIARGKQGHGERAMKRRDEKRRI